MSQFDIGLILPQVYLLVFGLAALLVGIWSAKDGWLWHGITPLAMAVVGLILALVGQGAVVFQVLPKILPLSVTQFEKAITIDAAGTVFGMIACLGTLIVVLMSADHFEKDVKHSGEYYFLLMYACCAVTIVSYAADFIAVYLSLEFLSLTSYALAGFHKQDVRCNEAAIKYFLFGGACSAAMLYGMSLLFGMTGTLNLAELSQKLAFGEVTRAPVWIAIAFVLTGIAFKIAAAPFHVWSPDVYEGAPTPVTAFLSIVSKAAGLILLLRFLQTSVTSVLDWMPLVVWISAISMTVGNLTAIGQNNVKRMLAYSGIAQAGYLLVGFAALGADSMDPKGTAVSGVVIYLLGYLLANLGAFACVVAVGKVTGSDEIDAYQGLMKRSPLLAVSLVVFFLSLIGIPPTLGFAGKFWLFMAAIKTNVNMLWWLAAIGVANSVISVYYYFNITRVMFFDEPSRTDKLPVHIASRAVVVACVALTVALLITLQPVAGFAARYSWLTLVP